MPRLAGLTDRNPPPPRALIEVSPARVQYLTLASAGHDQHRDDELQHLRFTGLKRAIQALCFLLRQVALTFVVLFKQGDTGRGVLADPWGFPLQRQVENVAHQDQQSIGGTRRGPGRTTPMVHGHNVVLLDLVQIAMAEGGQQVVTQQRFIGIPRALVAFDKGHVALLDERGQGRHLL